MQLEERCGGVTAILDCIFDHRKNQVAIQNRQSLSMYFALITDIIVDTIQHYFPQKRVSQQKHLQCYPLSYLHIEQHIKSQRYKVSSRNIVTAAICLFPGCQHCSLPNAASFHEGSHLPPILCLSRILWCQCDIVACNYLHVTKMVYVAA